MTALPGGSNVERRSRSTAHIWSGRNADTGDISVAG
jgi:hypothetical protein